MSRHSETLKNKHSLFTWQCLYPFFVYRESTAYYDCGKSSYNPKKMVENILICSIFSAVHDVIVSHNFLAGCFQSPFF